MVPGDPFTDQEVRHLCLPRKLLTVPLLRSVFIACKEPYKTRTLTEDASSLLGSSTVQQSRPPTNPQPQQYRGGAVAQNQVQGAQPRKRQRLE